MANGEHPLDALLRPGPKLSEVPDVPGSPLDALLDYQPRTTFQLPEPDLGFGGAVKQGFKTGLLEPLTIFGFGADDGLKADEANEVVGQVLGQMVGMGVSWIPVIKGTQLGLKGAGLAKAVSPRVFNFLSGTLGFGLWEAGTAEHVKDIPKEFGIGLLYGAPIEGLFLARAIKARQGAKIPEVTTKIKDFGPRMNPDILAMEQQIRPHAELSPQEIVTRWQGLTDPNAEIQMLVAEAVDRLSPNGFGILKGIRDPKKVEEYFQAFDSRLQVIPALAKDGLHEVLIFDPRASLDRLVKIPKHRLKNSAKVAQVEEFLGSGKKISPEEAIEVLEAVTPGERFPGPVKIDELESWAKGRFMSREGPGIHGLAAYESGRGYIEILKTMPPGKASPDDYKLSTLVHEYVHLLTGGGTGSRANIFEMFRLRPERAIKAEAIEAAVRQRAIALGAKKLSPQAVEAAKKGTIREVTGGGGWMYPGSERGELFNEFVEATIKVLELKPGLSRADALDRVTRSSRRYFQRDTELLSRMAELLLLDPKEAYRVAPRASRLMRRFLSRESPKIKMLFTTRRDIETLDKMFNLRWRQAPGEPLQNLVPSPVKLGKKQIQQWKSGRLVSGMDVEVNGRTYEAVGGQRAGLAEGYVKVFDPTGKAPSFAVHASKVHRPTFQSLSTSVGVARLKMASIILENPKWIGAVVKNPGGGHTRVVVETEAFDVARSIPEYFKKNKSAILQGRSMRQIRSVRGETLSYLRDSGKDGLMIIDNGVVDEVHIVNQETVRVGETVSDNFGLTVDEAIVSGAEEGRAVVVEAIRPSYHNRVESALREAGADDSQIKLFTRMGEDTLRDQLVNIAELDFKTMSQRMAEKIREPLRPLGGPPSMESVETSANIMGMLVDEGVDGSITVLSADRGMLGRFKTPAEAESFVNRAGREFADDLDKGSQIPSGIAPGGGGSGPLPKPQQTLPLVERTGDLTVSRRLVQSSRAALGSFTSAKRFALAVENLGLGRAWSFVYEPLQRAMVNVHRELGQVARAELNGRTFEKAINDLDKLHVGLTREERRLVTRYTEAMTKEELAAPGGFFPDRGMTAEELKLSRQLENLDLQDELPRLYAEFKMMNQAVSSQKRVLEQELPRLERRVRQQRLDQELAPMLQRLRAAVEAEGELTLENLIARSNYSREERWVFEALERANLRETSLLAVARHAGAPASVGGKTGQQMFVETFGLSPKLKKIGDEANKILDSAFKITGHNRQRLVAGFTPAARRFQQFGITLEDQAFDLAQEGRKWIGRRLYSGGLDLNLTHPVVNTYKHIRNILSHAHMDGPLTLAKGEIEKIGQKSPRTARMLGEFVEQLEGRPNSSFEKLQEFFAEWATNLGVPISSDFAQRMVNAMAGVTYQATIPFRAAIILRNYMQMFQMTLPVVGPKHFFGGLKKALTREGYEEAIAAGAIDVNVVPLFASTEILGSQRLTESLGPHVAKLGYYWEQLFNMGFNWYRSADDIGRAAAFHAGRSKVREAHAQFARGKVTYERFKELAKVKTFDEVIEREFDNLIKTGTVEDAGRFIGKQLADDAHFLYGNANHPIGWGGIRGRLFGQFGSFPVQYAELLTNKLTRGTVKDRVEFLLGHGAINAGLVWAGAEYFDLDLWSWATVPSLVYTGGPYVDVFANSVMALSGTESSKAIARGNLKRMTPFWGGIGSPYLPGSYAAQDAVRAMQEEDGWDAVWRGLGFRFMSREDWKNPFFSTLDWIQGF